MQHFVNQGQLLELLSPQSNIAVIDRPAFVWTAMVSGWRTQQASRGLSSSTVDGRASMVRRFHEYTGTFPWEWRPADMEEFTVALKGAHRSLSTIRQFQGAIRVFCEYLTDSRYDWVSICEESFDSSPAQICFQWNTAAHVVDYEGDPGRRALTYEELQTFFDTADARVEAAVSAGKKGAFAALRDAQLFKTVYAFGLRRAEARGLDLTDLHHNAQVPRWGGYAALHVRWGKAANGGAPQRRTVLLVPQFDWWIDGMRQWVESAHPRFAPKDSAMLWPTERGSRIALGYIDGRFAAIRDEANLDRSLTLHSLRHSYVTHLIEHGYADRFVQEQVGHRHASTTSIYTSVSGDFKNRVLADAIHRFESLGTS